jgi:hypothetical protein
MTNAGREPSCAEAEPHVEAIVSTYVAEAGGDPWIALRRVVGDALADLLEWSDGAAARKGYCRGHVRGSLRTWPEKTS